MEVFKPGESVSTISFEVDQFGSPFEAMSDGDPTHLSDKSFPEGIYTSPSEVSSPGWGSQELNSFVRDQVAILFHPIDLFREMGPGARLI